MKTVTSILALLFLAARVAHACPELGIRQYRLRGPGKGRLPAPAPLPDSRLLHGLADLASVHAAWDDGRFEPLGGLAQQAGPRPVHEPETVLLVEGENRQIDLLQDLAQLGDIQLPGSQIIEGPSCSRRP